METPVSQAAGITFTAAGAGPGVYCIGGFNIVLGAFAGTITLQRQDGAGNWIAVARDSAGALLSWSSGGFALSWEERSGIGAYYRLYCSALSSGTPYCEIAT